MKKSILITAAIFAYCILVTASCFSQGTAINNSGTPADSSAILDVSNTTQGLLIPRMSEAQKNAVPRPAPSLMIYQTDGTQPGYYFNAGDKTTKNWVYIGADDLGNHTATDSLDMSMKKIYNLATCTNNYDAANKEYVDGKVGAGGGNYGSEYGLPLPVMMSSMSIDLLTLRAAHDYCRNLSEGGLTGWRVPTYYEFYYVVAYGASIPDDYNPNYVWLHQPNYQYYDGALKTKLSDGSFYHANSTNTNYVRCVR